MFIERVFQLIKYIHCSIVMFIGLDSSMLASLAYLLVVLQSCSQANKIQVPLLNPVKEI